MVGCWPLGCGGLSKVGRNEPCPCGSGRKYKDCHLRLETGTTPGELAWRRLHDLTLRLPTELLRFARVRFGTVAFDEAWNEFAGFAEENFDPDSIHLPVFMPWFFYQWGPDPQDFDGNTAISPCIVIQGDVSTTAGDYQNVVHVVWSSGGDLVAGNLKQIDPITVH